MLKVTVQQATSLPDVDSFGKSDPYAKVIFQGDEKKTEVQDNNLDPVWNQDFQWDLSGKPLSPDDVLSVEVKDYEKVMTRKLLGKVEVPLGELLSNNEIERSYDLVDGKNNPTLGKIMLKLEYSAPPGTGGDGGGEGEGEEAGEEGEEGYEEDEEGEEGAEGEEPGKPGQPKRRKRRTPTRRGGRKWSTKVQDFQIRIRIIEGRQLLGNNIHPVVRVTVAGQRRETTVKRSTNKPVYNQTFFFNFHLSEAELFDDLVCLEVFNSRKLRSDSLLGYFECDIGSISVMKGHSFVRKWVLLSGPADKDEDEEEEGKSKRTRGGETPAGYLKVTAMVLGPGDKPPAAAKAEPKDQEDDIESNLLMPLGVTRQSAAFTLKVYHAEDLPQMDTGIGRSFKKFFSFFSSDDKEDEESKGKKGLVDPYMEFSFCGKKATTSTKYHDSNPEFKQFLKIPLMLPSMCERIKLQMFDWDRGSTDDCIGTAFINLSAIAGQGDSSEGFLPQFGPCFVNFYGSTREFTNLPDEHDDLNKGIGEGVAYRGRVLVELNTTLNEDIKAPTGVLANEDIIKAQPFLRREKYKLFVCFYEALMVSETDGPIEFEVSIGNNGNKFDESVAPCNTPSCNAVYDGCHYYYLPWAHDKPCVCVECSWEDIAFRLEPVNILNRLGERLRESLSRLKEAAKLSEVSDDPKLKGMLSSLFDNLVRDCRNELSRFENEIPKLPGKRNQLDMKLSQMRVDEFKFMLDDIGALQWKLAPPLEGEEEKDEVEINEMLAEIESYAQRIEDLAIEPQVSMPDVIIWMISGDKRVAYYRMPSHQVLFSETEVACGKYCGKTIELQMKYPGKKGNDVKEHPELPSKLRVEMWLGLEKQQQYWTARPKTEGDFCVFAETYENEVKIASKWTHRLSTRPHFSDGSGDLELPQDKFLPPDGWKFEGGWQKKPELSLFHDPDEGHKEFLVEAFENQSRSFPGGDFKAADTNWTDANNEEVTAPATQKPPPGWAWKMKDWEVDRNRAVDAEGWEYGVNPTYGVYGPVMKAYHMCRRRRLVRSRELVDANATKKQDQLQKLLAEGWGYAPLFTMKFHAKEKKLDFVRRRRWLLKMVPSSGKIDGFSCTLPPVLRVQLKAKDRESALCLSPRMFVSFKKPHKYQLWAYVYQARDLVAKDETGMNDPYARVAFANQSQVTYTVTQSPCPTWDQTLLFTSVEICEDPENVKRNPPSVVVELFDHDDGLGKDDFLGRCMLFPKVRLKGIEAPEPKLLWHKVKRGGQDGGEILAECELFLDEGAKLPHPPAMRGDVFPVRSKVRPVVQRTAVEVLCWGVRNMKKYQLVTVTSPSIEFECMGEVIPSTVIEDTKKTPNFAEPVLERRILNLPVDDMYSPPINIRVKDNRAFGRKPLVGIHSVKYLEPFKCKLPSQQTAEDETEVDEVLVDLTEGPPPQKKIWPEVKEAEDAPPPANAKAKSKADKDKKKKLIDEANRFDWWSKYFASVSGAGGAARVSKGEKLVELFTTDKAGDKADFQDHTRKYLSKGYDKLKIYHRELEKVPEFKGFNDFIATFPLRRGKTKSSKDDEDDDGIVGEFKGAFRIYPVPDETTELPETMFTNLPSTEPIECTVRVYVVLATELQPQDPSGLADPYLIVSLGKKKYDDQDNFKPNTLNPVFGKTFEFKASIPKVKDLKIQVMDYDYLSRDDLIGETVVDLEQRLLSRFHAKCGLQRTYFTSGPNKWRHCEKPFKILERYCDMTLKPFKYFAGKKENPDRIIIGDREYTLSQFEEGTPPAGEVGAAHERLALHILHTFNLVPEHVETRSLYSPVQPDIEQGKLQMWVDIFPKDDGPPKPPVVIEERKPVKQEVRVIIWNTTDVLLEEESITGEKMSDIYVKAWLDVQNDKQKTDVHYRSLDGDGNFNWRMVFPFDYMPIEKKLVVKRKEHFWSLDETEEKAKPKLRLQIWENDMFSSDDFIGERELDLSELDKPCQNSDHCGNAKKDPGRNGETLDLFIQKSSRGWWACYKQDATDPTAAPMCSGKIEMTVELLAGYEAAAKPAGQGREDPNQHPVLEEPNRPATSFLWFTSPFKTLRYIIWRRYKWILLILLILIIIGLLIGIFFYSMPGYTVKKLFGA